MTNIRAGLPIMRTTIQLHGARENNLQKRRRGDSARQAIVVNRRERVRQVVARL